MQPTHLHRTLRAAAGCLLLVSLATGCTRDNEARKQQFLDRGRQSATAGNHREAVIAFKNAIGIDPAFGEARAALAASYAALGNAEPAAAEYIRAADLLPQDDDLQLTAGSYLLTAGRFDEAVARADAVLARQPARVEAYILRGKALGGRKDFDDAEKALDEALRLEPDRSAAYNQLGNLEMLRGRQTEAERAFERAVTLAPDSVDAQLAAAGFYWSTARAAKAAEKLERALQLNPRDLRAHRAMALVYLTSGRIADAESHLVRLAELDPRPHSIFGLAEYYLAVGRPREAVARLEPLTREGAEVSGARQRLARALFAAGDRTRAQTLVTDTLKEHPQDPEALVLKGELQLASNQREEALRTFRAAVEAAPGFAPAQMALGRVHAARGDWAGAERAFQEVLKANPGASAARGELARVQVLAGNLDASLQNAEAAAKRTPDSLEARLALARSLVAKKDYARAKAEVSQLLTKAPNSAAVHVVAGMLASVEGNVRAARSSYERALALDGGALDATAGLVSLDMRPGDHAAAKARVEARMRAGASRPGGPVLILAARTYALAGDSVTAERYLRQAIEQDASSLQAYALLGSIYLSGQKLEEARREFEALAARQSRPVSALTMTGVILQTQGRTDEARKRFEEVVALDRYASVASNNLAWIYAEAGENLDSALELAQAALSATPDSPEIMDTLGWVYYRKGLASLAVPVLKGCIEKVPQHAMCQYHLGLALLKTGDQTQGRLALERALAARPDADLAADIRRALAGSGG